MSEKNSTYLADTGRNNLNYQNDFEAERYCWKCDKKQPHDIHQVAIHSRRVCKICGASDDDE